MKTFKQHILEKLKISNSSFTLFPKSKDELERMITDEIRKNGNKCSLNHIDVSKITDMSDIFFGSEFNGDISEWDVSNVENMEGMFYKAKFNGDISNWDVSKVTNMYAMFYKAEFNGDISNWDVSSVTNMAHMFNYNFGFNGDLSKWDVSNAIDNMDNMFDYCALQNNPPAWYKQ